LALTLTEGEKYSTTELDKVVIDLLVKDSLVLEVLQFVSIMGNSLTYDMIIEDAGAAFYDVGDTWVESTLTLDQDTVKLKRLGGDVDIDNFLLETHANKIDLKGTVLQNKVKAVQYKFVDTYYYGTEIDAKGFSGLQQLLTNTTYNTVYMATDANGASLTVMKLRETIDLIKGFKPKHMFMSKLMRRRLSKYLDSVGADFQRGVDEFGRPCRRFDDLEIVVDDHILDTESNSGTGAYADKSSDDHTTIWIPSFVPQGVCGIHGQKGVWTEPLGALETKDATRYRVKWYCGLKFEHLRSSAKLTNILVNDGTESNNDVAA